MLNYYYSDTISDFCSKSHAMIIGEISTNSRYGHIPTELQAWEQQIVILKEQLRDFKGHLFFEFSIPRMGKRVDCLLIIQDIVFVIEFKVGESRYLNIDIDQVWDYALDLKNFHKPSQDLLLVHGGASLLRFSMSIRVPNSKIPPYLTYIFPVLTYTNQ